MENKRPGAASSASRVVQAGPWRVTLHPPVLVYRGTRTEHITRPSLCMFKDAIGLIMQTTFDSQGTVTDQRHVAVSTDGGQSWRVIERGVDIGSFSLFSKPDGAVVVMPYDSVRYGPNRRSFAGPCVTLSFDGGKLRLKRDMAVAHMPKDLMTFWSDRPTSEEQIAPPNKPIACFWGTIVQLKDDRWIIPGYCCFEGEPRTPDIHPETAMHGMAKFSAFLLQSSDQGRTSQWLCTEATPHDVPEECSEGPDEAQFYELADRWRVILRVAAMNIAKPLHYSDSFDRGKTWTKQVALEGVDDMMDPRGLIMPDGPTVLCTGRKGCDIYLAEGASVRFHKIDIVEHHNACLPDAPLNTITQWGRPWFYPNSGHTDIVQLGPSRLLFAYDRIPDGWRWKDTKFTAPDAIYTVIVEVER